jgi:hypothetical protein
MEKSLTVFLVYEPPDGRPVTVARIGGRGLLINVAEAAITEAQARAELLRDADQVLGDVEREEAARLERVLKMFVPELNRMVVGPSSLKQ